MNKNEYEILQTAIEYIEKLNKGIIQASSYYRNGQLTQGYEYVGVITDGIEWLIQVVTLTQDVLTTEIEINHINELISDYVDAMQNEDTILMADLLEYEIVEEMQRWYNILIESVNLFDDKSGDEA